MRVYVESNFALEFARQQEESDHVLALMTLAESRQISLVLPAFALSEPYSTLACILRDAASRPASDERCFLSRNTGDFGERDVVEELRTVNCRYIGRFGDGLSFVRSRLPPNP